MLVPQLVFISLLGSAACHDTSKIDAVSFIQKNTDQSQQQKADKVVSDDAHSTIVHANLSRVHVAAHAWGHDQIVSGPGEPHTSMAKQVCIPMVALLLGAVLMQTRSETFVTFGKFAMFFGMQAAMNLYMKATLSDYNVGPGMNGVPAPFAVTALQQLVGFLLLVGGMWLSRYTNTPYTPQPLKDASEYLSVTLLSLSFVLNIALNNFSLVFLDISVNMAIRSLQPVTTYITQLLISKVVGEELKLISFLQAICLTVGCLGTVSVVYAKAGGQFRGSESSMLGSILCLLSLVAASFNMCMVALLGSRCKLNTIDSLYYMSCPAFAFLVVPALFYPHQVNWEFVGHRAVTDAWIVSKAFGEQPLVLLLASLSGVFALSYNALLYFIVQTLSATQATFAGSFNKVATIVIAIGVGLEHLPTDHYLRHLLVAGIIANTTAFCCYTLVGIKPGQRGGKH